MFKSWFTDFNDEKLIKGLSKFFQIKLTEINIIIIEYIPFIYMSDVNRTDLILFVWDCISSVILLILRSTNAYLFYWIVNKLKNLLNYSILLFGCYEYVNRLSEVTKSIFFTSSLLSKKYWFTRITSESQTDTSRRSNYKINNFIFPRYEHFLFKSYIKNKTYLANWSIIL